jgi:hypothetical protein
MLESTNTTHCCNNRELWVKMSKNDITPGRSPGYCNRGCMLESTNTTSCCNNRELWVKMSKNDITPGRSPGIATGVVCWKVLTLLSVAIIENF